MNLNYPAETGRKVARNLPVPLSNIIADITGLFLYYVWPKARYHMKECAAAILKEPLNSPIVCTTARRGMRNFTRYCADFVRYSYREHIDDEIAISGLTNLDNVLAQGKGAILTSLHLGNFDIGIRYLSKMGYPLYVVVDHITLGQLNGFVNKCRQWSNVHLIYKNKGKVTGMVEVLRNNGILVLMLDCPDSKRNLPVKFGNRLIIAPPGAATLALRTGAKILACGLVRDSKQSFHGFISKPIGFTPTGNLHEDTRVFTQHIFEAIEPRVKEYLDQWYVFRRIFEGQADENPVLNPYCDDYIDTDIRTQRRFAI